MSMEAGIPDVFLSLVCYLAYAWCASRFLRKQLWGKPWEGRVFGTLLFCGNVGMALFLQNSTIPYILYAMGSHGLLIGLSMAVFGGGKEEKLLAAVMLAAMTGLIWNFSESFLQWAGLLFLHAAAGSGQMAVMGIWGSRAVLLATYAAGITTVRLLSGPLSPVFAHRGKSWYLCLTAPLACIILVMDLANWAASNGIMVQNWEKYGLYGNQLFSHGAMCLFTGLAMAAAGFLVFGMDRIAREEEAGEQYRAQVMYYQMLEEQYSRMERLRHDMKNHMMALENLVQNRQWERAGSYLRDMAEAGSVTAGEEATGSLVMDALLYHKRCQAVEEGIRWQCDAKLPKDSSLKEMELCIIAGNILDNAIEGCCRLRETGGGTGHGTGTCKDPEGEAPFVKVYMGTIKKCFFLEVSNSTDLADIGETGKSRKSNPQKHGHGLANIRAAVSACNGAMHLEVEKGVFTISVLLPLYQEAPL